MSAANEVYYDWLARHERLSDDEKKHDAGWKLWCHRDQGGFPASANVVEWSCFFHAEAEALRAVTNTLRSRAWKNVTAHGGECLALLVLFRRTPEGWVPRRVEVKELPA